MKKSTWYLVLALLFFFFNYGYVFPKFDKKLALLSHINFGTVYGLEMNENILFLSSNKGVEVVDVENPSKPKKLSRIKIRDGAFGIQMANDYLFVAGDEDGFFIADVMNPKDPKILSNYNDLEGSYQSVFIKEDIGFVGLWDGRLVIFDIKNPHHPSPLSILQVEKGLMSMITYGDHLLFGTTTCIKVINIADPSKPKIMGSIPGIKTAQDMDIRDHYLFVSSHSHGMSILDIDDLSNPKIMGAFHDDGEFNSSFLSENLLFVSDSDGGSLKILDIQNLSQPTKVEEFSPFSSHSIIVKEDLLYVATVSKGLRIYQLINK
jgi:hypothetical protein